MSLLLSVSQIRGPILTQLRSSTSIFTRKMSSIEQFKQVCVFLNHVWRIHTNLSDMLVPSQVSQSDRAIRKVILKR